MALPVAPITAGLKALGTLRKAEWLLAVVVPVIGRMKSPSIRTLLVSLLPKLLASSFEQMKIEDREVVLAVLTETAQNLRTRYLAVVEERDP